MRFVFKLFRIFKKNASIQNSAVIQSSVAPPPEVQSIVVTDAFKNNLEHKIWATRGTRFVASGRLLNKNSLSSWAVSALSAYLIILSLLTAYRLETQLPFSGQALSFASTSISILVLIFSQIEGSSDYKIRARNFHQCGLELSEIYNYYVLYKNTSVTQGNDESSIIKSALQQYEAVLRKYENHEPVDYEFFQCSKPSAFGINKWQVFFRRINFYIHGPFIYHILIFLPPIIFTLLILLWHKPMVKA